MGKYDRPSNIKDAITKISTVLSKMSTPPVATKTTAAKKKTVAKKKTRAKRSA